MKYATARPYADPEKAARRSLEIANAVEPIQGRIHIEKINEPFLFRDGGSPAEYGAGLKLAIERGPSSPSRRPARNCSREKNARGFSRNVGNQTLESWLPSNDLLARW